MNALKIVLMAMLLTAGATTAFGQQGSSTIQPGDQYDQGGVQNPGRADRSGTMSVERREEVRKKIEAVRVWRLNEALKLDPASSAKLSSLLSSFDQQRRDIRRAQMQVMRDLRLAIRSKKPDESKLKAGLDHIENNHHAMQELSNNELRALKDVLTIEQQVRYLIFQQEFMREMRSMIHSARGNKGGRMGMGPGSRAGMGGGPMQDGPDELSID